MENILKKIISRRKLGKNVGIPSYCTANELIVKALLINAKSNNKPVLIEATANQVNQYGGYTGMRPADFAKFVHDIAKEIDCPKELIALGGDHLGPAAFPRETMQVAMEKSKELVRQYVMAGFTKIHLDTNMYSGSTTKDEMLMIEDTAKKSAILYSEAIKAFNEMGNSDKIRPVFVIGSEFPVADAEVAEHGAYVTDAEDFKKMMETYKYVFDSLEIENAFDDIIAIVVQPGIEFSGANVIAYDRKSATKLSEALEQYEGIVFEVHTTDYQPKEAIREMAEDGAAILKVGPALTFRLRETLSMFSHIEKDLVDKRDRAQFEETLERVMVENPSNWQDYYQGPERRKRLARKYSFLDRCRYYLSEESVQKEINKLLSNLAGKEIPINILHQYMPVQYQKIARKVLKNDIYEILFDAILEVPNDYEFISK